jgi:hypothetical protein
MATKIKKTTSSKAKPKTVNKKTKVAAKQDARPKFLNGLNINKYVIFVFVALVAAGGFFAYRSFAYGYRYVVNAADLQGFGCWKNNNANAKITNSVKSRQIPYRACSAQTGKITLWPTWKASEDGQYRICVFGRHTFGSHFKLSLYADNAYQTTTDRTWRDFDETQQVDNLLLCNALWMRKGQRPSFILEYPYNTWLDITNVTMERI